MKIKLFVAMIAVCLLFFKSSGQSVIHLNTCSWVTISIQTGSDGIPVTTYEIGNGPDGYYSFYTDETESVKLMEGELENGLRQGLWKFFRKDGLLYLTAVYADNLLNGAYTVYNSDGTIAQSIQMQNDKPVENQ